MRFPIPSSVTYAFAEGSFGLRFPFGLRFVVFFVVGGRKNQDFTPLTEYPPGGVLRNDYFANGRGLGHAPGLLQIWALSGVQCACSCGPGGGRPGQRLLPGNSRGTSRRPFCDPVRVHRKLLTARGRRSSFPFRWCLRAPWRLAPRQGSGCSQLLDWCPLVAHF